MQLGLGLAAQAPLFELWPSVKSAGFRLLDHAAIVAEQISVPGVPERAVVKRRAEFLAGRLAAQRALHELGLEAELGRNADGSPAWPGGVVGSITHGAERAFCLVASTSEAQGLGVDCERLLSDPSKDRLMERICRSEERRLLMLELERTEPEAVTLAFSAKESLYKCLYPLVGRYMDFYAAEVVAVGAGELVLELSVDWSERLRRGRRFEARFALTAEHVETAVLLLPDA